MGEMFALVPEETQEPLINSVRVDEIFKDCLFNNDEINEEGTGPKEGIEMVVVEGITNKFGLHKERLESHREEVKTMLSNLPDSFREGMSFLNACQDKNDVQWTSFHLIMEQLVCLGIGLELAEWNLLPDMTLHETAAIMPGGMPYFTVKGV